MPQREINKPVIEKWVAALESGEYQQGDSHLHRLLGKDELFCCLGVLCDLAVKEGVIPNPQKTHALFTTGFGDMSARAYGVEEAKCILPAEVIEWAGFDEGDSIPIVADGDTYFGLSYLNDALFTPFPKIARLIRDEYLGKTNV